jgi:hypothetical protein
VLRDVINSGVDPHYWFAGVRAGLITNDTDFIHSEQKIKELSKFLKENVSKEERQHAKMANFGFGGGMQYSTFYKNGRKQGVKMTIDAAKKLREDWVSAFPEVNEQFKAEPMPANKAVVTGFGLSLSSMPVAYGGGDDDDDDDSGGDKQKYRAHLINGMVRSNGSYCSILNIQFQGTAAYGLKLGLWNMAMAGFLPRIVNEVHDEVNYWLYPRELKEYIPVVEKCMIDGMRLACPDVKVKVETTCMLHWDKNAVEFKDVKWDDEGRPIIEEPPFVKEVYGLSTTEKEKES